MLPPRKWLEKALRKTQQINNKYTTGSLLLMISDTTKCAQKVFHTILAIISRYSVYWLNASRRSIIDVIDLSLGAHGFIVPEKVHVSGDAKQNRNKGICYSKGGVIFMDSGSRFEDNGTVNDNWGVVECVQRTLHFPILRDNFPRIATCKTSNRTGIPYSW